MFDIFTDDVADVTYSWILDKNVCCEEWNDHHSRIRRNFCVKKQTKGVGGVVMWRHSV